jgi:DNA-binding NarL/FixJ family response regulator
VLFLSDPGAKRQMTLADESKRLKVLVVSESAELRARIHKIVQGEPKLKLIFGIARDDSVPDVEVLDLETNGDEPVPADAEMEGPSTAKLILTDELSGERMQELLASGSVGVLHREAEAHEILAAIESIAAGLIVVSPRLIRVGRSYIKSLQHKFPDSNGEPLTPRETEVLKMLAEGLTNREIASGLRISENTVKYHLSAIFGKFGAASRTEAVMVGIHKGIIML